MNGIGIAATLQGVDMKLNSNRVGRKGWQISLYEVTWQTGEAPEAGASLSMPVPLPPMLPYSR